MTNPLPNEDHITLEAQCAELPGLIGETLGVVAAMTRAAGAAKQARERIFAERMTALRVQLTIGGKEPSVAKLENAVEIDAEYQAARTAELDAECAAAMAKAHYEAARARKDMLKALVFLRVGK